jgi:hypothetical protein
MATREEEHHAPVAALGVALPPAAGFLLR